MKLFSLIKKTKWGVKLIEGGVVINIILIENLCVEIEIRDGKNPSLNKDGIEMNLWWKVEFDLFMYLSQQ